MIGQPSQALGNVLLVLLVPSTLVATLSFRASVRATGPDAVGPALAFCVAVAARWALAAAAAGLLAYRGGLGAASPSRGLQVALAAGLILLVDHAAGSGVRADVLGGGPAGDRARAAALVLGYVLPTLVVLLLAVPMNVRGVPGWAVWTAVALVGVTAVSGKRACDAVVREYGERRRAELDAFWAEHHRLTDEGTRALAALPADAPPELVLPFLADPKWPGEVRGPALDRLAARPRLWDELLVLLRGPHRDMAVAYVAQAPEAPLPAGFAVAVRDAVDAQAREWEAAPPGSADAAGDRLSRQCQDAANLAYRFQDRVDFRGPMGRWRAVAAGARSDGSALAGARSTLDHWLAQQPANR